MFDKGIKLAALISFICLAAMLLCAVSNGSAEQEVPLKDVTSVVSGNTAFALDLYSRLKGTTGNLFFSPYSISTALAMTYAGAGSRTSRQIQTVLRLNLPDQRLHPAFAALQSGLEAGSKNDGYELHIANRLWGQKGLSFLKSFLNLNRQYYGSGFQELDFARNTEDARQTINSWVEEQTRQKIKDLIRAGTLQPDTRLVLTNAIYFQGEWKEKFNEKWTKKAAFHSHGKMVSASMMTQTRHFSYMEGEDFKALQLPHKGKHLAMLILLPDTAEGLSEFEKKLTPANLDAWISGLRSENVTVEMPRFKMTSEFELSRQLVEMDMEEPFSISKADFSRINGAAPGSSNSLYLSLVIHKAYVDVNEKGTEAAAATAVQMLGAGRSQEPKLFRADHPFIFMIRDLRSGSVLFIGRVVDPS